MGVKGGLRIIVMKILSKGDSTGYGLIKKIKKETGFWEPSPGSMYPLMNELLKKGLVKCAKKKNQKIYSITSQGKKSYQKINLKKSKIQKEIIESIKFLETLGGSKEESGKILKLFGNLEKNYILLERNLDALSDFKETLLKVLKKGKNTKGVDIILKEASKKLNQL